MQEVGMVGHQLLPWGVTHSSGRGICRRVDCEGMVWVLVEYEPYEGGRGGRLDADLSWISFKSEESLNEFIVRCRETSHSTSHVFVAGK